jgi:hypothetical protein
MKVLICGGRRFGDWMMFYRALDRFNLTHLPIWCVIHGDAPGADTMAHQWATARGLQVIPCPADWETYGRGAGYMRNKTMLMIHKPQAVIAFPGGPGTQNMVGLAQDHRVPVYFGRALANGD